MTWIDGEYLIGVTTDHPKFSPPDVVNFQCEGMQSIHSESCRVSTVTLVCSIEELPVNELLQHIILCLKAFEELGNQNTNSCERRSYCETLSIHGPSSPTKIILILAFCYKVVSPRDGFL